MGLKPSETDAVGVIIPAEPGAGRADDDASLASLMDAGSPDGERSDVWRPADLAAVLRHQLTTPLHVDLGPGADEATGTMTFGELFEAAAPPVALLERVKAFAKAGGPGGPLPPEVARVLYYLSILVARARCGRRISALSDADLARGARTALAQPWLDERARQLIADALRGLGDQSQAELPAGDAPR